jgi:hypothetical protein
MLNKEHMQHNTTLSIPASSSIAKPPQAAVPMGDFSKKRRRILTLPGLTGPIVLIGSPRTKSVQKGTICHDILSLLVDIFDLRGWRKVDPLACFMLAGYTAAVAQPLVFGSLGNSIVALMMPTK